MNTAPFKITIEHYDEKYTLEKDHSDVNIEEVFNFIEQIPVLMGFHPDAINEHIQQWAEEVKEKSEEEQ